MKNITILFIALLSCLGTWAQTPEKMSFQAVVRDAAGDLITDTTIGMQISVLMGSPTGTAVYVETHTPTTNTNGLATVEIGDGTVVTGSFSAIFWELGSYYLKTEIDPAGGTTYTIESTTQLISVPYALLSKDTENKNTLDEAYDEGGAGLGKSITADAGPVEIIGDGDFALEVVCDPDFSGIYVEGVTAIDHAAIYGFGDGDAYGVWGSNSGASSSLYGWHNGTGNALDILHLGTGKGIFLENAGTGLSLDILQGNPANATTALIASTMGTGGVAFFNTDDNNANLANTLVTNNNAAGSAAQFIITDEVAGKVNGKPAVEVLTNGKGPGMNVIVMNPAMGADMNAEPAVFAKHDGYGNGAFLETPKSDNTKSTLEIKNNGTGHGAHIDSFGNPGINVEATLYVEQGNSSTVAAKGRTAIFDLHPAGTSADAAVLIRSSATSGGSSALRVIPADATKLAAVFEGDVEVASDITIGGMMSAAAKAFKIDHPLDPENKFLVHNSIESNERVNIYSGNITTDIEGYATVQLPDYMSALNRDYKYQLTIVDKEFAQAIIWEPLNEESNSFVIKTSVPEIKLSWQVTGTRQDTWALENPMQVEVAKNTEQ
ncbi:hypothetical protein C5O00_01130 [Pukyongia salina]|uniref:Big-1 domain-containing protein n=1 Tax=Pukyongia salina TaxID=2094025 RepID=A0A2S0HT74_9FLAO|nr:hypothetical protein [Pukyongia salina]AVI49842.1 hypothetical protein C5O00_01130 [Pukyongia salina]